MDVLGPRALGRATLARQLLLRRAELDPVAAVEHLAGMQAQHPLSWYTGLWSRLAGFDPAAAGAALADGRLVRLPLMRSTVHLVSARDALAWRPLVDPVIERSTLGQFGRHLGGLDRDEVAAAAAELTAQRALPASELGRALAARFPGRDPGAIAQAARAWLPMVQVPPRGVWGRSGRALQAPLADRLRGVAPRRDTAADLVRRYLGAFGPATVRDAQRWCGLTRLAEVVDGMADLVRFRGEDGAALVDLPGAPRPGPDAPAPVRFLYDYDALLLSHDDRSRIVGGADYAGQGFGAASGIQPSSVLVDGTVGGTWRAERAGAAAVLTVRPFRRLTPAERADVTAEGIALLAFLHPGRAPDVRLS